jgi:Purple acid Phosphatase, N-terminal domain
MIMATLVAVATILVIFKPITSAISYQSSHRTVSQIHLAQGKTSASMTVSWVTPSSISSEFSPSLKPTALNYIRNVKLDKHLFRGKADGSREKSLKSQEASLDGVEHLQQDYSNEVRYSTVASNMYLSAVGYSTSYVFNYRKLENYTSGILHHTLLTNLLPSTVYYYRCGDFSTGSDSDVSGNKLHRCYSGNLDK